MCVGRMSSILLCCDSGPAVADVAGAWETRRMSSSARDARRLTPVEVATAGALSGLAVTFGLIAAVTPVFQLFFQVATAVPLAMVSLKLRPRAAVAAFASTILLAIAVGGIATAGRSFQAALVGLIIGFLHKKRASWLPVGGVAAGLGVVWGVGTGIAFWILSDCHKRESLRLVHSTHLSTRSVAERRALSALHLRNKSTKGKHSTRDRKLCPMRMLRPLRQRQIPAAKKTHDAR